MVPGPTPLGTTHVMASSVFQAITIRHSFLTYSLFEAYYYWNFHEHCPYSLLNQ